MTEGRPLLFYVNGHGFGHATRCAAVIEEIWRIRPRQQVLVRTSAPAFLFRRLGPGPLRLLPGEVDPGTLQADPLTLDRTASLAARKEFQAQIGTRVAAEVDLLREASVALVVGDIPPLAFPVAAALGVPGIALGNFSWDWIYEAYVDERPEHAPWVEEMRRSYRQADLLLRLPLHAEMDVFSRIEDIPLVVRHAARDRSATRRGLGLAHETRPVVLVSFGGFAAVRFGPPAAPDPGEFRFITFGDGVPGLPADTLRLPIDHPHRHEDLVAAADAVITKPGYGTVAECLASRTPFLYTSRDDFREYHVLVREISRQAHAGFLGREDLLHLRWRAGLEALLAAPPRWADLRVDGAAVAARRLLALAAERWSPAGTVC